RIGADGLTSLIDGILADLSSVGTVPTPLEAELSERLEQFRGLCRRMTDLRVDHNNCQHVENALSLAATLPEVTPNRVAGWAAVKRRIKELVDRRPTDPLAARLGTSVDQLEAAADAAAATEEFTTLLVRFRSLFNRTDEDLFKVTDDLLREA